VNVRGGTPPFRWQLPSAPAGWSIHASPDNAREAIVEAEAASAGLTEISIIVTGSDERSAQQDYSLRSRESCWFAYVSLGQVGATLELLDPFAEADAPTLLHNSGVYDFAFSPNGRYLAYAYGANEQYPHGQHLALVDLTTLAQPIVSFGETAVTAFAWSPDGSRLAVAYSIGDASLVGAVAMTDAGVVSLSSVSASVGSELSWVGNSFVAYYTDASILYPNDFPAEANFRAASYAKLGPSGFEKPIDSVTPLPAPISLLPTSSGFYTLGQAYSARFTPVGNEEYIDDAYHGESSLIGGSGAYSARIDLADGALHILKAETGEGADPVAVSKPGDSCKLPLAWARGSERIGCVVDFADATADAPHGELRFFDLVSGSATLSSFSVPDACPHDDAGCVAPRYRYDSAGASGRGRGFSESGRFFAFTTLLGGQQALHWSDLQAMPPTVRHNAPSALGGPSWVSFSPDEAWLLARLGEKIVLTSPTATPNGSELLTLASSSAPASDCSDDFMLEPERYCGAQASELEQAWAPDSSAVAVRAAEELMIYDASYFPSLISAALRLSPCDARCSGRLAFQPPLRR
jgi:hypothetical protein